MVLNGAFYVVLIIYAYLNLYNFVTSYSEYCPHFFCRLSPWIRNVFGLHIDETSIGPQIVISTNVVLCVVCSMY